MADVSVVVPTLGRGRSLRLALASVLKQRDVDLEVIVVDDGPSNTTAPLVEHFDDTRIRLLRHGRRRGAAAARNTGIAAARGDWVAFLDDDDLWAPDKLCRQLAAVELSGRHWVYTGAAAIDDQHRVLHVEPPIRPEDLVAWLPRHNVVPAGASNILVRARELASVGGFDETLRYVEDWELFLRLAGGGVPAYVEAPLVAVREHSGQSSLETRNLLPMLAAFEARHDLQVDRAAIHRDAAWACLRADRRLAALGQYAHAVLNRDVLSVARAGVVLLPARVRTAIVLGRLGTVDGEGSPLVPQVQAWVNEVVGPDESAR